MKISTITRYGLRVMIDLAIHYKKGKTTIKEIANRLELSVRYLETIVRLLAVKGLIKTTRGKFGGIILYKDPSEITLYDIILALEGSFALVDCIKNPKLCKNSSYCGAHYIWKEVEEIFSTYFKNKSLKEVAQLELSLREKLKKL